MLVSIKVVRLIYSPTNHALIQENDVIPDHRIINNVDTLSWDHRKIWTNKHYVLGTPLSRIEKWRNYCHMRCIMYTGLMDSNHFSLVLTKKCFPSPFVIG